MPFQGKRNQLRKKRIIRRTYRRYNASINNNDDLLNRVANLPQQITDDKLIYQFFNGFSF
jgi:hypothetical protein